MRPAKGAPRGAEAPGREKKGRKEWNEGRVKQEERERGGVDGMENRERMRKDA